MDASPTTPSKPIEGAPAPEEAPTTKEVSASKGPSSPETSPPAEDASAPSAEDIHKDDPMPERSNKKTKEEGRQIPTEQRLTKEQIKDITQKMGHIGQTALIAATLSEKDRRNAVAEAISLKSKERHSGLINWIPIIGQIARTWQLNKDRKTAEEAISQSGNLADAFTALDLKPEDSKTINSNSDSVKERAWQLLQNSNYNDQTKEKEGDDFKPDEVTSHLDKEEIVEKVDAKTQKAVKEALNEYYFGLKKDDAKEEDLTKAFNEQIDSALKDEKDPILLKKAIDAEKAGLKEIANEKKDCDKQIKAYLSQYLTLYRTNMREGIYTQKKIDQIAEGVMQRGFAGGILAAVATRGVGMLARNSAKTLGLAGLAVSAVGGGVVGYRAGLQKANIKLADAEINAATTYKNIDLHPDKSQLDRIEFLRDRKLASDLIKALDDKLSKYDSKDESSKKDLLDLYADIVARSQFSSEKNIDLIKYQGDDRKELEKRIDTAEKKILNSSEPGIVSKYKTDPVIDSAIKEHKQKLEEKFNEAKKEANNLRNKTAIINAIQGAAIGAAGNVVANLGLDLIGKAAQSLSTNDTVGATGLVGEDAADTAEETAEEVTESSSIFKNQAEVEDFLEGKNSNIDLTNEEEYQSVYEELKENYNIDLQRETIDTSRYGETSIGNYLENAGETVEKFTGVDWSRSATRVIFGSPTVVKGDGMDEYVVPISGINGEAIPYGSKFYIDLDGEGPGKPLEYEINFERGEARIPADVLDTSQVGNGGVASFIGTARVGSIDDDGTMISYATAFGKDADLSTKISASTEQTGFAFTAVNMDSHESISQFAIKSDNTKIDNLSEIFNGRTEHLPKTFTYDIGDEGAPETITLASGEQLADLDYQGGYHEEFDSYRNDLLIENKSYLGTPIQWDANGDGEMNAAEEASYFRQLLVRTGTNPFILGQNASNYGLLEPERLEDIIPRTKLIEWGIKDGVVDSEKELNVLLENLKLSENADYYDALANATINEMENQLDGGGFTVETITDRISTYANSNHQFDTIEASTERIIIFPHDADGKAVGNIGWLCRKYGVEGGKVGNLPLCGLQAGTEVHNPDIPGTGNEGTGDEGTGNEGTGNEGTGDEGTGSEDTGDEGTGDEDTGNEGTGDESTGDEETGNEDTGDEGTGDETSGDEGTDFDPKDDDNMERIDNDIEGETEQDSGTEDIQDHNDLDKGPETDQPTSGDHQGTEPETSPSEASQDATPAQNQTNPDNNYSDNRGGSHDNEYHPVEDNNDAVDASNNRGDHYADDAKTEETFNEAGID